MINNGEFHKIGPDFYDENAAMIEKGKNCVWGQKGISFHYVKYLKLRPALDIGEELKKLATEFGHTKFTVSFLFFPD